MKAAIVKEDGLMKDQIKQAFEKVTGRGLDDYGLYAISNQTFHHN